MISVWNTVPVGGDDHNHTRGFAQSVRIAAIAIILPWWTGASELRRVGPSTLPGDGDLDPAARSWRLARLPLLTSWRLANLDAAGAGVPRQGAPQTW